MPKKEKNIGQFGERLKLLRGRLTQQELADILGITQRAIVNYETGGRIPKGRILRKICEYFNASEQWLLTGAGPMNFGNISDESQKNGKFHILSKLNLPLIKFEENDRHVGRDDDGSSLQHIETIKEDKNKTTDTSVILALQKEIIGLLREKNEITEQNAALRLQLRDRDERIKALERELDALRRELASQRLRQSGQEAG